MRNTERLQVAALLVASGGREDLGTRSLCELNRGEANATGRRMDQHAVAGLHSGERVQSVVRRQKRDGNGCRFGIAQVCRLGCDELRRCDDVAAERAVRDADHALSGFDSRYTLSNADDGSAELVAEWTGIAGVHAEGIEYVAEVQSGGRNRDLHFPTRRRPPRHRSHFEIVENTSRRNHEVDWRCRVGCVARFVPGRHASAQRWQCSTWPIGT